MVEIDLCLLLLVRFSPMLRGRGGRNYKSKTSTTTTSAIRDDDPTIMATTATASDALLRSHRPGRGGGGGMEDARIPWTVADLFRGNDKLFVLYHAMGTSWDLSTPVGCVVGAGLHVVSSSAATSSFLQTVGTTGLGVGCLGMLAGAALLVQKASQGAALTPIPWTDEGIQQRAVALSRNFNVRVLDFNAWSGMAAGALVMVGTGGPTALGMAPGALGVLQTLTLASSAGSLVAMACIYAANNSQGGRDSSGVDD